MFEPLNNGLQVIYFTCTRTLNMLETKDNVCCSKSDWSYGKLCPTPQERAIRTCAVNVLIKYFLSVIQHSFIFICLTIGVLF